MCAFYLDDGTLMDHVDAVLRDVKKVIAFRQESWLELNISKCEVMVFGGLLADSTECYERVKAVLPGVAVDTAENLELFGAPLMNAAVLPMLDKNLGQMTSMFRRLSVLSAQEAI